MRKLIYSLFTLLIMLTQVACAPDGEKNSILKESNAPFGAPEFGNFRTEDYKDACLASGKSLIKAGDEA